MKKNTKFIIGISAAVVVLGIILVVILLMPSDENKTETTDIILINKTSLDVDDITVKNQSGEYQILGYDYSKTLESGEIDDIPLVYTMQGYEHTLMSKLMTDNLVSECKTVAATKIVDKSGKKYIDYGLDKPRAEVKVIYSDLSKVDMFFGNEAPDKSGTYCRIDGDKNVYLVNSGSIDMFFMDKLQLFDKNLTGEMSETEDISEIELSGKGYEKSVIVTDKENNIIDTSYVMTSPYNEPCDNTKTVNYATGFFDMKMSTVAAAEVNEDDIKKFGLSEPYMDIKIKTTEREINILVSETEDEKYYIMKKDGNIIYQTDDDEFKYYGLNYMDFLSESIFKPEMPNVKTAEITYQNKTYEYILEREKVINDLYEESLNTTMYYNGETVNYGNLLNFVENLSNIKRTYEFPENRDGFKEIFKITLKFEKENYSLVLYENDEKKTLVSVDGDDKCLVDTEFVQKILAMTEKIPTDEPVEIIENS